MCQPLFYALAVYVFNSHDPQHRRFYRRANRRAEVKRLAHITKLVDGEVSIGTQPGSRIPDVATRSAARVKVRENAGANLPSTNFK